jgi:hypothetical protein
MVLRRLGLLVCTSRKGSLCIPLPPFFIHTPHTVSSLPFLPELGMGVATTVFL